MEHVDTKVVTCIDISALLDEHLADIGIAFETRKVKGSEAIT